MPDKLLGYVNADSLFAWLTNKSSTPVMDAATFDRKALQLIYGDYPPCLMCHQANGTAFHHMWKRGYQYGYRGRHRKLFSSVFNSCPLCDHCHNQGNIHYSEIREMLASQVYARVMQVVEDGLYTITPIDYQFLSTFYDSSSIPSQA